MSKSDPEAVFDLSLVKKTALPPFSLGLLLAVSDGLMLALLGWTYATLMLPAANPTDDDTIRRALITGLMLVPLVKSVFGIYSLGRFDYAERTRRTVQASLLSAAILVVPTIVMDAMAPFFLQALGLAILGFFITYVIDLVLVHGVLAGMPQWQTPVVIVGAGEQGALMAEKLRRLPWLGMRPVCFFDDDETRWQTSVAGLPVVGPTSLLRSSPAYAGLAQAAIVADTPRHGGSLAEVVRSLPFRQVYCVVGDGSGGGLEASYHNLHGSLALRVAVRPQTGYLAIRRTLDILVSGAMLLAAAPLMLMIMAAIKLESRGPVFFRQTRWAGGEGATFGCLKFRSMHVDAEEQLKRILATNAKLREEYQTYHKLTVDPRITRVGRFLRKTSLDELPQLINILKGDMSLIGPRAYMPSELPEVGAAAAAIGTVRPGLTGYWQVSGRHRTTFQERVAMDVFYVRNCGLVFDLYIFVKTVFMVLKADGS